MTGVPANPQHPHRCSGRIQDWQAEITIDKRASLITDSRCTRVGSVHVAGSWFCYAHVPVFACTVDESGGLAE